MKKLLLLICLLPLFAQAQYTNQTVRKTISGGALTLTPSGDSLYTRAQTRSLIPSVPPGLQDSLTKKANKTFDNVASGAIAKSKADTSATGLQTVSNFFPKGDTRYAKLSGSSGYIQNQTASPQTAGFNIQSDSYIGGIRFGLGGGLDTNNTAIGRGVMRDNLTGKYLTALGYYALRKNTADYNTALGYFALLANTTGTVNTAVGAQALWQNTTGSYNLAIGVEALAANTTGINNTAIGGYDPMISNTIGSANTAVGYAALKDNVDGSDNSVVGSNALSANVSGIRNAAFGSLAGEDNTGSGNTYIGVLAGKDVASGGNNTYLGYQSGLGQTAGSFNIAIGENTVLPSLTGSNQLNIGNTLYGDLSSGNMGIGEAPITVGSYKTLNIEGTSGGYIRLSTPGTGRGDIYGNINGVTMRAITGKVFLIGTTNVSTLAGSGDVITGANNTGDVGKITVGSGLSLTGGVLTATGGSSGSVTTSGGTAGRITKFTSASNVENSIMTETSGNISIAGNLSMDSSTGDSKIYLYNSGSADWVFGTKVGGSNQDWSLYNYGTSSRALNISKTNNNAVFTGTLSASNLSGTNTGDQNLAPYATLASPALTGTPTAPTPSPNDNSTKVATTAYVDAQAGTSGTYTPTLTNVLNISSSSVVVARYLRVGDQVSLTLVINFAHTTGSGASQLDISLPVASNFTTVTDAVDSNLPTSSDPNATTTIFEANTTNDRLSFFINSGTTSNQQRTFFVQYIVK